MTTATPAPAEHHHGAPLISAPADARPAGARFPCFDGLRAIAALAVVVYHVCINYEGKWLSTGAWSWITRLGNFGVSIFFLISGFLLYRTFVVSFFEGRPAPSLRTFWSRRFLRIFPAYWVAVTAVFFIFFKNLVETPVDFITYYGLLQNYRSGYVLRGLGIAWTLVIEVSFYVALPFIAMALRALTPRAATLRTKLAVQLGGLLGLYVLALVVRVWSLWYLHPPQLSRGAWLPLSQLTFWLIGYLDWFALGMLLAVGSAWLVVGGRLPSIVETLGRNPVVCWILALELFWVAMQLNLPTNQGALLTEWQYMGISFFYGLVALFVILPAVFGQQDQGRIRGFLRSRVMVMLGVISYGIYLWHIIYVKQVVIWTGEGNLPKNLIVWFAVVLALTLVTATASYVLLERPIISWSHRPHVRPRPRDPAAPDAS